eukprot:TRINITY_DN3634_c1_g1_i4.p1 TRINITY_DN3634_c1_g1~~TRINITY_DN3634_c1_g1_i4.p1  ORF type:complete len:246 (+),score=-11.01 TRINITY_DN3634_c1_g1_i4:26-739(+)
MCTIKIYNKQYLLSATFEKQTHLHECNNFDPNFQHLISIFLASYFYLFKFCRDKDKYHIATPTNTQTRNGSQSLPQHYILAQNKINPLSSYQIHLHQMYDAHRSKLPQQNLAICTNLQYNIMIFQISTQNNSLVEQFNQAFMFKHSCNTKNTKNEQFPLIFNTSQIRHLGQQVCNSKFTAQLNNFQDSVLKRKYYKRQIQTTLLQNFHSNIGFLCLIEHKKPVNVILWKIFICSTIT